MNRQQRRAEQFGHRPSGQTFVTKKGGKTPKPKGKGRVSKGGPLDGVRGPGMDRITMDGEENE